MTFRYYAHEVPKQIPGKKAPITEVRLESKELAEKQHYTLAPVNFSTESGKFMFEICQKCNKPIGFDCYSDEKRVCLISNPSISWHQECFECSKCNKPLSTSTEFPFYKRGRKKYMCRNCMDSSYSDTCFKCNFPIMRYSKFEKQYSSMDGQRHWHFECFICYICKGPLNSRSGMYSHETNEGIFCRSCYDLFTPNVCNICKKQIRRYSNGDRLVTSEDGLMHWHYDCFKCANCGSLLAPLGQYRRSKTSEMLCETCHQKEYLAEL